MRTFNKGDIVICKKFDINTTHMVCPAGMFFVPYIDDKYFNRKAYISETYKEYMGRKSETPVDYNDKDEYRITFLDTGESLAWVRGDELILLLPLDGKNIVTNRPFLNENEDRNDRTSKD